MYYYYYGYEPYANQYAGYPYRGYPAVPQQPVYNAYQPFYPTVPAAGEAMDRQQAVRGQATWTEGGPVTECGMPWSTNNFMTVAVGPGAPYQCGETIRVKNMSSPDHKEISVRVVDEVEGYPANRINLHRKAFEALGANLSEGIINVEIKPLGEGGQQQSKWGDYLSKVVEAAFPDYRITARHAAGKTEVSPTETKESFTFTIQSAQETRHINGTVHYNPDTNRVISVELKES